MLTALIFYFIQLIWTHFNDSPLETNHTKTGPFLFHIFYKIPICLYTIETQQLSEYYITTMIMKFCSDVKYILYMIL